MSKKCVNNMDCLQAAPYIASLPAEVDLPFMWTDEELRLICNEGVRSLVQRSKTRCEQVLKDLKASSPACPFTRAEFDWALACVLSRSFLGPHPSLFFKV
jgi:hypothetical protein